MFLALIRALGFFWTATRGYRLRPWLSPYLRWRMETYSGIPASTLKLSDFIHLAVTERAQVIRFLLWTGELQALSETKHP